MQRIRKILRAVFEKNWYIAGYIGPTGPSGGGSNKLARKDTHSCTIAVRKRNKASKKVMKH